MTLVPPPEVSEAAAARSDVVPAAGAQEPGALPAGTPPLSDPSASRARPLAVGTTVKHYELLRQLGEGGMGTVYLARDTTLGRLVAIKVLQQHAGPSAQRFLIEAQATARCRHDNIVVIHEVDELQGYPYMVLEYLEGRTLREWMAQREPSSGPVSPSLAVELMLPVARALACAHQLGIVHRDLKPENIFLTASGRVVVLDFGIAKQLEAGQISELTSTARLLKPGSRLTQEGALVGTMPYMSPEQLRAEDVDARSDLWAMGILLYELVTGAHPLTYRSMLELLEIGDSDDPMPRVGDRRPDVGALGTIIDRCLEKPRDRRYESAEALVAALEAVARGGKASELGEDESPFTGLSAFQEADAERYVGREREVVGLVGRLRNQPLVVVAGPSGTGKSSFVRAGLIPALKRSGERWEAFILRPGRRPLAALADLIAQLGPETPEAAPAQGREETSAEAVHGALLAQPGRVGALLRARCRRAGSGHRILLFVDQFEELYTLGADAAARAAFVACLEGVADDASSPLRVVLSLRSDFLYRMADDGHFVAEGTRGLWFLRAMGRDGLRQALTRPLEAARYRFETEAMVEAMVEGLGRTKIPLPLLQFTAAKLWEARDRARRLLTQDSYEQLGGVAGALSAHANAVLAALSATDQRLCRAVLLRLCTPERTRAVVSLADLRELAAEGEAVEQVIQRLADARLVLIEAGGEGEGATVELCHESLIESWDKLRQWLAESEQDAHFVARLHAASQQWEASQEAEGLLWRDRAAREAAEWLTRRRAERAAGDPLGLGQREERFLVAVVALSERGRRRRQRIWAGVLATVSVIAVVVSLLSIGMKRAATRADRAAAQAAREAEAAQAEARQARNAARMAAAGELEAKDPTTMLAVLREVEPPGVPRGWAQLVGKALRSPLAREERSWGGSVFGAAWSPDGQRIVAALLDGTARVWKLGDPGEPIVLRGHRGWVWSAAFSPDGTRIVTASGDGTARVWSADGAGEPIVLRGHQGWLTSATFSPDGVSILTASKDKTERVWRADGTGQPVVLRAHDEVVNSAAHSPDGRRVATGADDGTARVWNADGSGRPIVLRGHAGPVQSVAWSPDGTRVATGSDDKTVRVWKADGTGEPIVLRGHAESVGGVAWSPDGARIVTTSQDKTVRVWSADGTGVPLVLRGHRHWVYTAAWSPDGTDILTASSDGTTRVFRVADLPVPIPLQGHEAEIHGVAFSADNQRIATASRDRTARVWSASEPGGAQVLRGHEGAVEAVAFSPDHERVVTGSEDRTARVWRADGAGLPVVLRGHDQRVMRVAFSPDGGRVLTVSEDGTARVWRADGTGPPVILRHGDQAIRFAAFSPDGKHVATGSADRTVRVWTADGAEAAQVLRGPTGAVKMVAWSPDGQRISASGVKDAAVHVWRIDRPGEPVVLRGHARRVDWVAWSPDGQRLVTASADQTARVWSADGAGDAVVLRGHELGVLFAAWSPDGARIVTTSGDETIRVWSADGAGEPYVLSGNGQVALAVAWSPDGTQIVAPGDAKTAWVWPTRGPLRGTDDLRLWTPIPYCMAVQRRIDLLRVSEPRARSDQEACERRVKAAGAAVKRP